MRKVKCVDSKCPNYNVIYYSTSDDAKTLCGGCGVFYEAIKMSDTDIKSVFDWDFTKKI